MFIEWTTCIVDMPNIHLATRVASCHIKHLEVDIIGPSLAIDGAEVMRAGTHHCHTVHLYFEQYMIARLLALHGNQVPMQDGAGGNMLQYLLHQENTQQD